MSWPNNPRPAKSLVTLRSQVNAAWPTRDKSSDGMLASSPHHAANPNSDHEAWVVDANGLHVVTALDITHDPAHGPDAHAMAEALRASRDPRIKYIISNRQICSSYAAHGAAPWAWRPYTGTNPHTHHFHVSVKADQVSYDNVAEWKIKNAP